MALVLLHSVTVLSRVAALNRESVDLREHLCSAPTLWFEMESSSHSLTCAIHIAFVGPGLAERPRPGRYTLREETPVALMSCYPTGKSNLTIILEVTNR